MFHVAFTPSPLDTIRYLWIFFGLCWLVSALWRKKTKRRESWTDRLRYTLPLILSSFFLVRPEFRVGWLVVPFVPRTPQLEWTGAALTALGIAISLWARWHLGSNWSGIVTLKQGHELIRTGPYRFIRHPIYTGIVIALLGTALTLAQVRALVAVAIVWLSFYWKARREERFLREEFGPSFEEHARRTGMFLPRFS